MITSVIIFLLFTIIYEDFRYRAISWVTLLVLLVLLIARNWETEDFGKSSLLNMLFVLVQLTTLTIYISFKNKRLTNIIDSYLGLGDILLLVIACTALKTHEFIMFYMLGLCFSLVAFMAYRLFKQKTSAEIPLAGLLAIVLCCLLLSSDIFDTPITDLLMFVTL